MKDLICHHLQLPTRDNRDFANALRPKPLLRPRRSSPGTYLAVAHINAFGLPVFRLGHSFPIEVLPAFALHLIDPYVVRLSSCKCLTPARRQLLPVLASLCDDLLHPFELFIGNDRLMPSPDLQDLHLDVVQHLLLLKVIRHILLMICKHADIDRVLEYTVDIYLMPVRSAGRRLYPSLFKFPHDPTQSPAFGIPFEDLTDSVCLLRIHDKFPSYTVVAQYIAIPIDHAFLHGCLLSSFYTGRCFPALVLGKGRHDCEPQFSIWIKCLDSVTDKIDLDIVLASLKTLLGKSFIVRSMRGKTLFVSSFLMSGSLPKSIFGRT